MVEWSTQQEIKNKVLDATFTTFNHGFLTNSRSPSSNLAKEQQPSSTSGPMADGQDRRRAEAQSYPSELVDTYRQSQIVKLLHARGTTQKVKKQPKGKKIRRQARNALSEIRIENEGEHVLL